ncbi:MAG: DUF2306 domain-containing protein [Sphingobacteriia bacterium]|nr:DUF2306 domain-containing protein [Sphingobacteriia bacterium]
MTLKPIFIIFWTVFAGLFLFFFFPVFGYMFNGLPERATLNTPVKKIVFSIHILCGVVVYITAFLQFAPFIRNRHMKLHRQLGKLCVAFAMVCIATLYYLIYFGKNVGRPFWPSQYTATTFWLLFTLLAVYFARQKKILWHRRFMLSGFICAAYFVTVRLIDRFCMGIFNSLLKMTPRHY